MLNKTFLGRLRGSSRAQWAAFAAAVVLVPLWTVLAAEFNNPRSLTGAVRYLLGRPAMAAAGWLCLALPFAALALLTARPWIPALLYAGVGAFGSYVNYYKKMYRQEPVVPLDIYYVREAASIRSEYKIARCKIKLNVI